MDLIVSTIVNFRKENERMAQPIHQTQYFSALNFSFVL